MKNTYVSNNLYEEIKNTSLALGFFDGIHYGHKTVLNNALDFSKKLGTRSVVLTFRNHPVEILYNVTPEFITTPEERIKIFHDMGFDVVIMADFTQEIAKMDAEEYFDKIIKHFSPKSISIGYNHKFGLQQSGDIEFLNIKTKSEDFILGAISPIKIQNQVASSTLIRNLIKNGQVNEAANFLGYNYSMQNTVIKGTQRGRTIDFPTANIEIPNKKIVPKFGVYAGFATINNKKYQAIANVGLRPTFSDRKQPLVEVFIINFDEDIYGKNLTFEFTQKIRDELKFLSISNLQTQIKKDLQKTILFLKK